METPLIACSRRFAWLATTLLALSLSSLAHAGSRVRVRLPVDHCAPPATRSAQRKTIGVPKSKHFARDEEDEEASRPLTEAERLRTLMFLATIMLRSGETPPPDYPPDMVVKPPRRPPHDRHGEGAGGHPRPTSISPEPATMFSGLLGSGMAWLYAWSRKRRRRCASDEAEINPRMV